MRIGHDRTGPEPDSQPRAEHHVERCALAVLTREGLNSTADVTPGAPGFDASARRAMVRPADTEPCRSPRRRTLGVSCTSPAAGKNRRTVVVHVRRHGTDAPVSFIASSAIVAKAVRESHTLWLAAWAERSTPHENNMRSSRRRIHIWCRDSSRVGWGRIERPWELLSARRGDGIDQSAPFLVVLVRTAERCSEV